jgi:predicted secreted protein
MPLLTAFAIYFIVWWLCLFIVLPFRVRNQVDDGEWIHGTERGAPVLVRFWPKLLATTLLAAVVTALVMWGLSSPFLQEYWS